MNDITKQIIRGLNALGIECWLCGGTARDIYMGNIPVEIDMAVKITLPELIAKVNGSIHFINEYDKSVIINYKGQLVTLYPLKKLELVNTYYNFNYTDSLEEDAHSRDFTVNSLYHNSLTNEWIDFLGAKNDINNKIIKFIDSPERKILESKVRLLRAPALAAVLGDGWTVDQNTIMSIYANRLKLMTVNPKQIYPEIIKVLERAETPSIFFRFLLFSKILEDFFPELLRCVGLEQSNKSAGLDLFNHIMFTIDSISLHKQNTLLLRTAGLLHDIGKPYTEIHTETGTHFYNHDNVGAYLAEKILYRWGFQKTFINQVTLLINNHLFDASPLKTDISIKKLINKVGVENIHNLLELRIADRFGTGRKNISMKNIYKLRDQINVILSVSAPQQFKLEISDEILKNILQPTAPNELEQVEVIKEYLRFKILNKSLINKESNIRRAILKIKTIPCPLGELHLYKTQLSLLRGTEETLGGGNLACGLFCNFLCNKFKNNK